jgi:hypothetical protein
MRTTVAARGQERINGLTAAGKRALCPHPVTLRRSRRAHVEQAPSSQALVYILSDALLDPKLDYTPIQLSLRDARSISNI